MKAWATNLLLLAVVIVLLLIALYEPGIEAPEATEKLVPLNASEINQITIHNGAQRPIILKRKSATAWQMVEPIKAVANSYKIETVLKILDEQPTNHFTVDPQKLARYGLHKPQVKLILNGPGGEQQLLFGSQTPLNHYRYLRLGDEIETCKDALMPRAHDYKDVGGRATHGAVAEGCAGVVTIKDSAYYPVASLYTNFIASRLLPEGVVIASIQLPDFRVELKEGHWRVVPSTANDNASADQIAQWLDGWRYASSVDIEPMGASKADGQRDEVVLTLRSGEVLRWTISPRDDGLILGRSDLGIEYHMSDSQRDALLLPPQPEPKQQEQELTI